MDWQEIIVHTTTPASDAVSDLLTRCGATGTMIEDRADVPDPDKPHGYWELIDPALIDSMPEDVLVHAWLEQDACLGERLSMLSEHLRVLKSQLGDMAGSLETETFRVDDRDWSEVWKRFYKPFRAGKHLVVKPTWEQYDAQEGDLIIEMDPGMAFGSGTHETTGMCLELLESAMQPGDDVIDVGTGSGILAIGAARLGAGKVLAIDIDEDAVRVARENIERNGLSSVIDAVTGNLLDATPDVSCRVCVANIIADVIISFAAPLKSHIRPDGLFICSGIIREREDDVRTALLDAGYEILTCLHRGEWVAFLSRR